MSIFLLLTNPSDAFLCAYIEISTAVTMCSQFHCTLFKNFYFETLNLLLKSSLRRKKIESIPWIKTLFASNCFQSIIWFDCGLNDWIFPRNPIWVGSIYPHSWVFMITVIVGKKNLQNYINYHSIYTYCMEFYASKWMRIESTDQSKIETILNSNFLFQ